MYDNSTRRLFPNKNWVLISVINQPVFAQDFEDKRKLVEVLRVITAQVKLPEFDFLTKLVLQITASK
ncbi:hypothetical protein EK904_005183 [Melospiza melodia maxima]|nr:hypothetical protein EK904_005183 [Melospiza melodia maxima]